MKDRLKMCFPMTLKISLSATSLQALAGGLMRLDLPDGVTSDPFGLDHVPANLSARQAREGGLLTSGTFGRHGFISSKSADLQSSLVSRLRARLHGSILF